MRGLLENRGRTVVFRWPSFFLTVLLLSLSHNHLCAQIQPAKPAASRQITGISLVGRPVIVFDHLKAKPEPDALPDAQITGWKNADGTVNITIPHSESYRMQGPDLLHLKTDPHKIFSSIAQAGDIVENHFNYYHWFLAPYTLDGQNIYVLTHTEWYACLLVGDCAQGNNQINSWATTNNSLVSTDGGASWALNGVDRAHLVAATGDHWTGTQELKLRVYRKALNHSGLFTPSRLIKEGDYYYSIGFELHRNFKDLNLQTGEAPIDKYGYALIRTKDVTKPSGWEAWVSNNASGGVFHPIEKGDFSVFLPQNEWFDHERRAAADHLRRECAGLHCHFYSLGSQRFGLLHDHQQPGGAIVVGSTARRRLSLLQTQPARPRQQSV